MSKTVLFNKYSSVYSCPDDINNFRLRLKIKEIRQNSDENELATQPSKKWFKKTIKWQEKLFNKYEREFYGNEKNCVTDLDKKYHEMTKTLPNIDEDNFLISTLIEGDEMLPTYNDQNLLTSNFIKFNINKENKDEDPNETAEKESFDVFDIQKSIQQFLNTPYLHRIVQSMQIIVDFGYYAQDNWLKNEKVICTMHYDKKLKSLSVYPDFNENSDPYEIKINEGTKMKIYRYYLENASPEVPKEILLKEEELVSKILNHKCVMNTQLLPNNFILPPKDKLYIYLFMEIESATNIENIPSYVQYFIDLPPGWHCSGEQLIGVTQLSYAKFNHFHNNVLHFGHCFDLTLEFSIKDMKDKIPIAPCIYFEIISEDYWDRFRTEGLAYKTLPISKPGLEKCQLQCFRFKSNRLDGELKRFFIGDCGNYDDITWIGIPSEQEGQRINKFGINTIGTGQLNIKFNIVHQSQAFLPEYNDGISSAKDREKLIFDKLNSSTLIQSVETVLKAFRRARKRMLEAKKNV